jgi:hypothetical protein
MKIEEKNVKDLIPYANNSRTHSAEQVGQIAASIKEFGFNNPILLDGDNGIIAGHGRLLGAEQLGIDKVPTIELKHLTDAQRKAYVIADNKIALNSEWDDLILSGELSELEELNFNMNLLGWGENIPQFVEMPDYGILDGEDINEQLEEMTNGVRKAIQIDFRSEDFEKAKELVKYWRGKNEYVGKMLIEKLTQEKKNDTRKR